MKALLLRNRVFIFKESIPIGRFKATDVYFTRVAFFRILWECLSLF